MNLRYRGFILVRVRTLLQCSADRSIAMSVLQQMCSCGKKEGALLFYISRVGPYRGDLFSAREREIGSPELSWWVLRRVVCSHTPVCYSGSCSESITDIFVVVRGGSHGSVSWCGRTWRGFSCRHEPFVTCQRA